VTVADLVKAFKVARTRVQCVLVNACSTLAGEGVCAARARPGGDRVAAQAGWPGLAALAATTAVILGTLRLWRPQWFTRLVTAPLRNRWRWWFYRRPLARMDRQ
jgi:hypothetical protein